MTLENIGGRWRREDPQLVRRPGGASRARQRTHMENIQSELQEIFNGMGEAQLKDLLFSLDKDGNGSCDIEEFEAGLVDLAVLLTWRGFRYARISAVLACMHVCMTYTYDILHSGHE